MPEEEKEDTTDTPKAEAGKSVRQPKTYTVTCPICFSENLQATGRCIICLDCGYSLCSM